MEFEKGEFVRYDSYGVGNGTIFSYKCDVPKIKGLSFVNDVFKRNNVIRIDLSSMIVVEKSKIQSCSKQDVIDFVEGV